MGLASRERGMEINACKSKTVNITKGIRGRLNIKWVRERKEQVEEIEYLGTTISANGKFDTVISNRVQKENQVYYYLNQTTAGKKEIHNNTKMRICQMVYIPTLPCDSKSWMMLTKHESRITDAEMRYLKKYKVKTKRELVINWRNTKSGASN